MNGQFEAAWQLHRFLTERNIPYVINGSIAVQRWGQPRLTIDVDLAILLPAGGEEQRLREIAAAVPARLKDAVALRPRASRPGDRRAGREPGRSEPGPARLRGRGDCPRESVVARQGGRLDIAHIRRWVEEFAQITADREVRSFPRERRMATALCARRP